MLNFLIQHPVGGAAIAGLFTWLTTALGAGLVLFFKDINQKVANIMLGFAGGVMTAASFWSLLDPAIEQSSHLGRLNFLPALIGFLLGGGFLWVIDKIIPHLHFGQPMAKAEGPTVSTSRSMLLILAITIHNIPEGLAVGVAFGAIAQAPAGAEKAALMSALAITLGIGLQNFPEGAAVSIPLRGEGMSRGKSFWYGQLSAVVEPISAVLGAVLVTLVTPILPYALAFAAGAMIFVVVEELVPTSQQGDGADRSAIGFMLGFAAMMVLDVAFG